MRDMIARPALCTILLLLVAGALVPPQQTRQDLRYESRRTDTPNSIHVVEVDPSRLRLIATRAWDAGRGRERVSRMATRAGALAAVNGGFFRIGGPFDGDPSGVLKIEGRWFSDTRLPRGAIGWREGGKSVLIDRLKVEFRLESDGWSRPVNGINRERRSGETVVYVAGFGPTAPPTEVRQVVVKKGKVAAVVRGEPVDIPPDGWVAAIPDDALHSGEVAPGRQLRLEHDIEPAAGDGTRDAWAEMDTIVGGTPVLIRDGRSVVNFEAERVQADFVAGRHPRTAVCVKPNGHLLLVAVDGRQPALSVGMTLAELTNLLVTLGCSDALNLDGGGSTTLFWKDAVVNSPSDPIGERAVSDAILILERSP